jgi:endonuclease/exonuclease/phosphatase family metal-dependent hydrolase
MRDTGKLLWCTAVLVAIGCTDAPLAGPELSDVSPAIAVGNTRHLSAAATKLMSRNLYIGFDVDETIQALATGDPDIIQGAIEKAITTLIATDFPARAAAVAQEVDLLRPDVLGLQEVYDMDVTVPGLPEIHLPFLAILQQALADRGLNYVVAAEIQTTDAQLPGISLIDHDALLVNPDRVTVSGSDAQLYTYNLGDPLGIGIAIVRGWTMIDASINGTELEIWNTHLESGSDPAIVGLRGYQAAELVGRASTELPVMVMGDLNDQLGSPMYDAFTTGGFDNVWQVLEPTSPGYTCCHAADLSNVVAHFEFDQRIDHVFVRGLESIEGTVLRTGVLPAERVKGPYYKVYASDHAGLFAALMVP